MSKQPTVVKLPRMDVALLTSETAEAAIKKERTEAAYPSNSGRVHYQMPRKPRPKTPKPANEPAPIDFSTPKRTSLFFGELHSVPIVLTSDNPAENMVLRPTYSATKRSSAESYIRESGRLLWLYGNRPAKRIPQAGAGVISCGRNLCGRRASKSSIFSA